MTRMTKTPEPAAKKAKDEPKDEVVDPNRIPDDEELEGLTDTPVKDLALAHGLPYIDRADAIAKLKIARDSA
jgi:hypothetical protein